MHDDLYMSPTDELDTKDEFEPVEEVEDDIGLGDVSEDDVEEEAEESFMSALMDPYEIGNTGI